LGQYGFFNITNKIMFRLPGMRSTTEVVALLFDLLPEQPEEGTLDVWGTHDATLTPTVSYLFGITLTAAIWPDFLKGLFLWWQANRLTLAWRGQQYEIV
jgi:hypothetical protein